jgi:hypothetical protein
MSESNWKGVNQAQIDGYKAVSRLEKTYNHVEFVYNRWRKRNMFSSVHKHWEEFDTVIAMGEPALRVLFTMLRGQFMWVLEPIRRIVKNLNLPQIEASESQINTTAGVWQVYLDWADKHIPPTAAELLQSATIAQEEGDQRMMDVAAPPPCSYGGTYFTGSLEAATKCYARADELRSRAKWMILAEKDKWSS